MSPHPVTITPANALALHIPSSDLGSAPFKQRFQSYLGRLDYQLISRNDFYFRYSEYQMPSKYKTSGGQRPNSAGNNFNEAFCAGFLTSSRRWHDRARDRDQRRSDHWFQLQRRPVVRGRSIQFQDHFDLRIGKHEMKFRVDLDTIHVNSTDRLTLQYSFRSLSQYLNTLAGVVNPATGTPFNYMQLTEQFGTTVAVHRTTPLNFFAEDRYQITPISRFPTAFAGVSLLPILKQQRAVANFAALGK
jgi:hypothetical protein